MIVGLLILRSGFLPPTSVVGTIELVLSVYLDICVFIHQEIHDGQYLWCSRYSDRKPLLTTLLRFFLDY